MTKHITLSREDVADAVCEWLQARGHQPTGAIIFSTKHSVRAEVQDVPEGQRIHDLDISVRLAEVLRSLKVDTIAAAIRLTEYQFMQSSWAKSRTWYELQDVLKEWAIKTCADARASVPAEEG